MSVAAARWRCPACHSSALQEVAGQLTCTACEINYANVAGRPLLTLDDNELFGRHCYGDRDAGRSAGRRRLAPGLSVNLSRDPCLEDLARRLSGERARSAVLLVGSGAQRRDVERRFARRAPGAITVVACDVAPDADVDVLCDAHELPFQDRSFDAVIATAVLEHVADPARVVSEIERVLALGGYLYSEIPFMQQVHEGAYDFTRFTMSGHRRLLAAFDELASGVVAGPATALAWSIEHFALAFTRGPKSRAAAKLAVRWAFGWLKLLDHALAKRPGGEDGASCTYVYGRLCGRDRADAAIVSAYSGAQAARGS